MTTLKDLEAASGISKSTISRVVNGDPNVKEATRERVWEFINRMNYKPNIVARGMIKGKLPMVLVIAGDIQNSYFSRIVAGIEKKLSDAGYMMVIYNSMYDASKERKAFEIARDYCFAGLIPLTGVGGEGMKEFLEESTCPTVLINKDIRSVQLDEVLADDFEAGYTATKILIDNGHRVIAHISADSKKSSISQKREQGYRSALKDNGIEVDESLIFKGRLDIKSGYEIAGEIFKNEAVTAVCSNNFLMGLGVVRYGRKIGKHLLKEYELSCCECTPEMYEQERIAYAGADLDAIGQKAACLLLDRINNSEEPRQKIYFSATKVYNPRNRSEYKL